MKTQVGIIGAGPAGLLLSRLLYNNGITSVIIEKQSESYVRNRERAGILEQTSVDIIISAGVGHNLIEKGIAHKGVSFHYNNNKHFIDLIKLNKGKTVVAYSQKDLIRDFIDKSQENNLKIIFDAEAKKIDQLETNSPIIFYTKNGRNKSLQCDFVIGCDGFHGISRPSIPNHQKVTYEKIFPYSLLGILSNTPPISNNIIFAHHPNGFGIQSMRGPNLTKFYLQYPNDTDMNDWENDKIWNELDCRLGVKNFRGNILDKHVVPLRSVVCNKLQYNRLFIAGDAAHIMPPTGAKGMNCAIADIDILSQGIIDHYINKSNKLLDNYSKIALNRIWKVVRFSWWMTSTLYIHPKQNDFDTQLQIATLNSLFSSENALKSFAENFAGLPIICNEVN